MIPTEVDVIIGKRLRQRRKWLDLTQAQVARRMGLKTHQQVQKYEWGANTLSVCKFLAFCKAVESSAADILQGLPPEASK